MSKDQKEIKVKKVDKKGKPLKGIEFKLYLDSTIPDVDDKEYSRSLTDIDGIAIFKVDDFYYGGYIKETKTIKDYILRNDEKDIVPFYRDNGVRFLGEIAPKDMKVYSINQNEEEKELNPNWTVNEELQKLVDRGTSFNKDTNWLVFNDNGKEKLIAKKPLKHSIDWNSLYNAGVVFGQEGIDDLINADFTDSVYDGLKDRGKGKDTSKTYEPTYVTLNGKKYIVRLIRAYSDDIPINDRTNKIGQYEKTKGSEWHRLILPLIEDGRYGSGSEGWIEKNMPTMANYSWWTSFGGNSNSLGNYNKDSDYGSYRWSQEAGYHGVRFRTVCGRFSQDRAAANIYNNYTYSYNKRTGWLPVLEKVDD